MLQLDMSGEASQGYVACVEVWLDENTCWSITWSKCSFETNRKPKGASADLVHSCGNDLQGRLGVLHQGVKLFSEQKACCLGS